jgi:hypothetical protein
VILEEFERSEFWMRDPKLGMVQHGCTVVNAKFMFPPGVPPEFLAEVKELLTDPQAPASAMLENHTGKESLVHF